MLATPSPLASLLLGPSLAVLASLAACAAHQPEPPPPEQVPAPAPVPVAPVPAPLQLDRRSLPAASVAGTIRGPGGQPLAGAQVCAWNLDPQTDDPAPRCTTSAGDGSYTLADLTPTHHELHASATDLQPIGLPDRLSLRPGERRAAIDLQLVAGGVQVRGVVRDRRGQPVVGAWISNFDRDDRDAHTGAAAARSDAAGNFDLWLSPGPHRLSAHADGFTAATLPGVTAPGRYHLDLAREAVLTGTVVDARTGAPVVGARVTALTEPEPGVQIPAGLAYTDATGTYRVRGLRPGLYKPRAEAPRQSGVGPREVSLRPGATSEPQPIALEPALSVAGRLVIAGTDRTCPEGQVTMYVDGSARVALADAAGEVYFPAVTAGMHAVEVRCPGAVAPPSFQDVDVSVASVDDAQWEFAPGRQLRGVVVDGDGKPVARAEVHLWTPPADCPHCRPPARRPGNVCQTDDQCGMDEICDNGSCVFAGVGQQPTRTRTISDAAGRFAFAGLAPGDYTLMTAQPGPGEPTRTAVVLAAHDLDDLRVTAPPPTSQIAGVVLAGSDAAVGRLTVELLADRGTNLMLVTRRQTDDDGRFVVSDVSPGDYRVRLGSGDESTSTPLPGDLRVRVGVASEHELELTRPPPGARIHGRLRVPAGAAATDAVVRAYRELATDEPFAGDRPRELADAEAIPDADGAFTLTDLPAGRYALRAEYGTTVVSADHVATGSKPTLTIPPTFTIAGRLVGAASDPFTLRVQSQEGSFTRHLRFEHTRATWAVEGLPPDRYELHSELAGGQGGLLVDLRDRSLADVELVIAVPATVRGTVVDAETRTPLGGVQVTVVPAGPVLRFAPWTAATVTDDGGRFEVSGLPPGPVSFEFPAYEPRRLDTRVSPGATVDVAAELRLATPR